MRTNQETRRKLFYWVRVVASGGELASLVGILRKMGSDFFQQTPHKNLIVEALAKIVKALDVKADNLIK